VKKNELDASKQSEEPPSGSCEHCGAAVPPVGFKLFGQDIVLQPACECRIRELDEQERLAKERNLLQKIRRQGLNDGLHAKMSLESWELRSKTCEAIARKLDTYLQNVELNARNWLYLQGDWGLGKTHIAVATLKYLCLKHGWDPSLLRWSEYCSRIQQSWHSTEADSEYDLWRRAANVTFLVLDDIDKGVCSEWALGKLYELIDHRHVRQLPTVLTANRSPEALAACWSKNGQMEDLAAAIISRILGQVSAMIEFSGDDRRLKD
jgi:DNA replication protein DnaC